MKKNENDNAKIIKVLNEIGLNRSSKKKQTKIKKPIDHSMTNVPDLIVIDFNEKEEQITELTTTKNLRKKDEFKGIFIYKNLKKAEKIMEKN